MKMICKLKNHVVTPDGDFLPEGLEVEVLSWSGNQEGHILIRTVSHIYAETEPEDLEGWEGNVGKGLYVDVQPWNLIFSGTR